MTPSQMRLMVRAEQMVSAADSKLEAVSLDDLTAMLSYMEQLVGQAESGELRAPPTALRSLVRLGAASVARTVISRIEKERRRDSHDCNED
jgi:hypothetical protein